MQSELPSAELCDKLERLISAKQNKEEACRYYLQFARELLVRESVISYQYVETERRSSVGDSDYIISGRVEDDAGIESVRAYVWELKAPQCYLFKKDNENRLIPTLDLFKAENQLLHYYHELKGNDLFRHEFGVTHPDYVHLGGIIIGSDRKRVSGKFPEDRKKALFERAMMIRRKYIYDPLNIRIMTWDRILDHLKRGRVTLGQYREIEEAIQAKLSEASDISIESL